MKRRSFGARDVKHAIQVVGPLALYHDDSANATTR